MLKSISDLLSTKAGRLLDTCLVCKGGNPLRQRFPNRALMRVWTRTSQELSACVFFVLLRQVILRSLARHGNSLARQKTKSMPQQERQGIGEVRCVGFHRTFSHCNAFKLSVVGFVVVMRYHQHEF